MTEYITGSRTPAPINKIPSQISFKKHPLPANNYFSRSQNKIISTSFKAIPKGNTLNAGIPSCGKHEPHLRKVKISSFRLRIWKKEEEEVRQQNNTKNIVKQQVKIQAGRQRVQKSQSCSKSVKQFIIRKTSSFKSYARSNSANERVISKDLNSNVKPPVVEVNNSNQMVNNKAKDSHSVKQIGLIDSTVKLNLNAVKRRKKDINILDISTRRSIGCFDDECRQVQVRKNQNKQNSYLRTQPNAPQLKKAYYLRTDKEIKVKSLKKSGKIRERPHSACKTIKIPWGSNQQKQQSLHKVQPNRKESIGNAFGLISTIKGEPLSTLKQNNLSKTLEDLCSLLNRQKSRVQDD